MKYIIKGRSRFIDLHYGGVTSQGLSQDTGEIFQQASPPNIWRSMKKLIAKHEANIK